MAVCRSELLSVLAKLASAVLIHEGSKIQGVKEVRGRGLLIGIELEKVDAKEVQKALEKKHILVNAANSKTIRIAPALVTNLSDVEYFLALLRDVLEGVQ
ncbi:MAG: aminotransferase class III-fold pyridoxal phosphate-dependent enzyme [Actinobacteria bacterium]|uniref:Aminotransferase class III-fold pyridoxal phosphate-dependent enzyme n=1 Tax=Candidatus Fonsibacter lacus TaxID=2576439 RepID=A0A965GCA2_9PROT|nr:aminotransferase class III-fold pyridoxal phosphate-dependent enzyme [Candidatus Fonsibacter lacus]